MSDKSKTNNKIGRKVTATRDNLPKQDENHVAVRKSHSTSLTKEAVRIKPISINRPATTSDVSFPSTSQTGERQSIKSMQDEVKRALEKYRRSAMALPEAESVSERIESQLAALGERMRVNQLLLESTRKQMEKITCEEEEDEEGKDNTEKDPYSRLEAGTEKLVSRVDQYQNTVLEAMRVMDQIELMNNFHDTSRLKRKDLHRREKE